MKSTVCINKDMHFLIYKITNLLDGKTYVGLHKTDDENDGYMGSGKLLKEDIRRLGVENFKKEILHRCSSEEEMIQLEEEIVNLDFLAGSVYNQMPGGKYGSRERNGLTFFGKSHNLQTKQKIGEASSNRKYSDQSKEKMSQNNFANRNPEEQRLHAKRAGAIGGKAGKGVKRNRSFENGINPYQGKNSPNFGLKRKTFCCPHCGKSGAMNTMSRWHFDKCKAKPE